jgi:translation initiation factor IF-2
MTTSKETEAKRPLKLNQPGKLQLKKTVETGQVRQSFSHGRSKAVTVEVKRSRTFERGTSGRMTEVTAAEAEAEAVAAEVPAPPPPPEVEEKPARRLSAEERASRARALELAREEEAARKEREAEEAERRAEQAKRAAEERAQREAEEAVARARAVEAAPERRWFARS